mgnify:CR=1 FL=1
MGDNGATATTHGIRRTFTHHDLGTAGNGAAVLELLLGDFAFSEETQQIAYRGFCLLTGSFNLGSQIGEGARDVASGKNANGNALHIKYQNICNLQKQSTGYNNKT